MIQGEVISHNPFSQREYTGSNKNPKKVINQLAGPHRKEETHNLSEVVLFLFQSFHILQATETIVFLHYILKLGVQHSYLELGLPTCDKSRKVSLFISWAIVSVICLA